MRLKRHGPATDVISAARKNRLAETDDLAREATNMGILALVWQKGSNVKISLLAKGSNVKNRKTLDP